MNRIWINKRRALAIGIALSLTGVFASPAAAVPEDMDILFEDEFERSDGAPGDDWDAIRGSWEIVSGSVAPVPDQSARELILAAEEVELGAEFSVAADVLLPVASGRAWNGIAVNVAPSVTAEGNADAYVLRIARGAADESAVWQLVSLYDSGVSRPATLITSGRIGADQGEYVRLELSTVDRFGRLQIEVHAENAEVVTAIARPAAEDALYGGRAGLYSQGGVGSFDAFALATTSTPAEPPLAPEPLVCVSLSSEGYEVTSPPSEILEEVEVGLTWAGHPVGQRVLTHGDDQYVAYYDENSVMTVAHRKTDSDQWTKTQLDSVLGWDSHNYVAIALDRDGNLHVSGNMHVDPMVYFKTQVPGDITTIERVPVLYDAAIEQRVTYPNFFSTPGGELVFTFRDGSSGDGVNYYYVYDEASQTWSLLLDTQLFDGEGVRNAYAYGPVLGDDGYYHISWVWRDTPDAATNSRVSYMRSTDLRTWETVSGDPVALPVTYATGGVVVDDIPAYGGLLNGLHKVGFDAGGAVTITYHKYDENGESQLYVARPATEGWLSTQVTQWEGRWDFGGGGSLENEIYLGFTRVLDDGRLGLDYTCHGESRLLVLDDEDLSPHAELIDPPTPYPDALLSPMSDYPGIIVQWSPDLGSSEDGRYVLRWETLPPNRDQPREVWPDPQPLRLYLLGSLAADPSDPTSPVPSEQPTKEPDAPDEGQDSDRPAGGASPKTGISLPKSGASPSVLALPVTRLLRHTD